MNKRALQAPCCLHDGDEAAKDVGSFSLQLNLVLIQWFCPSAVSHRPHGHEYSNVVGRRQATDGLVLANHEIPRRGMAWRGDRGNREPSDSMK